MSDIKYITIRTRNAKMLKLYGDKLTWVEKFINVRSNGLHMECQFSDRYGGISASSTMRDGVNGFRFKMIGYTHGYRWSIIRIPVTAEQEARIFAKACEMADMRGPFKYMDLKTAYTTNENKCFYGPNHIKYDRQGVMYSFITGWRLWRPSNKKNWCNESVALLLMEVWPDLLITDEIYWDIKPQLATIPPPLLLFDSYDHKEPHDLLPDETEYMIANYFKENNNG